MLIVSLTAGTVQASGKTNVVVMLGDSTTLCSPNKPGAKLTDLVQAYLTQEKLPARVVNSGVGGDTAKGGFGRLQAAVLDHKPAVVTISFGLNDTGLLTPVEYREWMEKIIKSIRANSRARILLITSTPFNNARHAWKDKYLEKGGLDKYMDTNICDAMRSLAKKYNLPLCDLHEHFVAQFKKDPALIDKLLFGDGVHLTDQGNEVAAKFVAPYIARLLGKPDNIKMP
jgi:lysophospholipase L1-like esterase